MDTVFHTTVRPAAAKFILFCVLVAGALHTSRAPVGIVEPEQRQLQLMHVFWWKLLLPLWKQNSKEKIMKR